MAVTASRPSGRRADDVRALRFRFRTLAFTGAYATGGDTILASSVGLKRILAVVPLDTAIRVAGSATGFLPAIDVASDGRSATIRMLADAAGAAQASLGVERSNGSGEVVGARLPVLFVGE